MYYVNYGSPLLPDPTVTVSEIKPNNLADFFYSTWKWEMAFTPEDRRAIIASQGLKEFINQNAALQVAFQDRKKARLQPIANYVVSVGSKSGEAADPDGREFENFFVRGESGHSLATAKRYKDTGEALLTTVDKFRRIDFPAAPMQNLQIEEKVDIAEEPQPQVPAPVLAIEPPQQAVQKVRYSRGLIYIGVAVLSFFVFRSLRSGE